MKYQGVQIVIVTKSAEEKVSQLIKESQIATPDWVQFLRISVLPGGCSGLRYQTFFDYETKDGDIIYTFDNFEMRIDKMSHPYLEGATFDFVDTIEKQGFIIDNPNATGTCACGDSFH